MKCCPRIAAAWKGGIASAIVGTATATGHLNGIVRRRLRVVRTVVRATATALVTGAIIGTATAAGHFGGIARRCLGVVGAVVCAAATTTVIASRVIGTPATATAVVAGGVVGAATTT